MRSILIFLFLLPGLSATAQEPAEQWDLNKCIDYALENNLDIQQAMLGQQSSEQGVKQSIGQFFPSLNASAYYGFNFGQRIDPFTNEFAKSSVQTGNINIGTNWTLFSGLQIINTLKKAQYDLQASQYNYEYVRYMTSLAVTTAYLQILFNLENVKVAEEQLNATKLQVERTRKLVDAGSTARGNLLDIEAQYAREELTLVDAQNALVLAYLDMKQLLRLPGDYKMEIIVPDEVDEESLKLPQNLNTVIQTAFDNYPSIKRNEYNLLSAEKDVNIAQASFYPTLSLNGTLGSGYSQNQKDIVEYKLSGVQEIGFVQSSGDLVVKPTYTAVTTTQPLDKQLSNNFNQSFGFSLSIPIFNKMNVRANVNRAKIGVEQARTSLDKEKQTVRQNIEKAYADALAAFKRYKSTEKSLDALREAYDYANKRYEVGMLNAVDFNLAKNSYTRAQSDLIKAKYEYVFRMKILDFYQGIPLKL